MYIILIIEKKNFLLFYGKLRTKYKAIRKFKIAEFD